MALTLMNELSEKEVVMFKALGWDYLLNVFSPMEVMALYKMAIDKAFTESDQVWGPAQVSLRNCAKAISACKPYRCTPEWDSLINC